MSVGTKKVTTSSTGAVIAETVSDLVDGALHGAQGKASIAATVGDIAASCVPGIGEAKALRDVFDGLKSGDVGRTIGGLVGLIPVAGSAANAGSKAIQQIGKEATEKGLSVAALQFSRAAAASAKQTVNSPAFKKSLGEAGERAFQRATHLLTERLRTMAEKGETPDITAREHQSWSDARDAAFRSLGGRPDASWQSLYTEDGDKKIVGKHQALPIGTKKDELYSARGFRFIEADPNDGSAKDTHNLMWWRQDKPDSEPKFGVETFPADEQVLKEIEHAYRRQKSSFNSLRRSA